MVKNIIQTPVIRGSFPAASFRNFRHTNLSDTSVEPWHQRLHAEYFINTIRNAVEALNPYERDYRIRMILESLAVMIQESSDWLWDEYLTKVVGLEPDNAIFKGLNNTSILKNNSNNVINSINKDNNLKDYNKDNNNYKDIYSKDNNNVLYNSNNDNYQQPLQSRRNSISTNLNMTTGLNSNIPWSNKDKFDNEIDDWSSDLRRRASPDKFLEIIFGWSDGNEEDFCPGGRKLVGAKTWANERKLELESQDDKLGTWQMCGFRVQKS